MKSGRIFTFPLLTLSCAIFVFVYFFFSLASNWEIFDTFLICNWILNAMRFFFFCLPRWVFPIFWLVQYCSFEIFNSDQIVAIVAHSFASLLVIFNSIISFNCGTFGNYFTEITISKLKNLNWKIPQHKICSNKWIGAFIVCYYHGLVLSIFLQEEFIP